jgi:RNA polymerase sigma-70 factor (ECF subfamily)
MDIMSRFFPAEDVVGHLPALMRYARMLARHEAEAEDLVQEALLRAHERRSSFRLDQPLKPWLLAIVHNVFVSGWRRSRAEEARIERIAKGAADHQEAAQEGAAYLGQIARRFDALPDGQREVLHLVAVEGLSYREVADALAIPVGTVMSRLSRARATLRREDNEGIERQLRIIGGRDGE